MCKITAGIMLLGLDLPSVGTDLRAEKLSGDIVKAAAWGGVQKAA